MTTKRVLYTPERITGWMQEEILLWLTEAASHGDVVEVGCWRGRSTAALLNGLREGDVLYAVDSWAPTDPEDGTFRLDAEEAYEEFARRFQGDIASGRLVVMRMDRLEAAPQLKAAAFALVFLDGDHRYEKVKEDIRAFWPMVKSGGIMAGHDWGHPGVTKAVTEMLTIVKLGPESLWSIRKP